MWWMVGQQDFFQLELFGYTCPVSQPLPADWRPSDIGWTRYGIVVADFDACLVALKNQGVSPLAPAIVKSGRRHIAIRDPYVGMIVEVIESDRHRPEGPIFAYATSSVSDLESARNFYSNALELEIRPLEDLHSPSDEALWGLPGAERDGFVVSIGGTYIEVVHYRTPVGRPKPTAYQISDQGIQNIAVGGRRAAPVARILERVAAAGYVPPYTFNNGENICGYITDPERSFEFASIPEEFDTVYGFKPVPLGFMGKHVKKN
jgi:catechol 2,3-dioxygenase-like lactoylglutathione lyase family enzyme